jgi:hypothetical protein
MTPSLRATIYECITNIIKAKKKKKKKKKKKNEKGSINNSSAATSSAIQVHTRSSKHEARQRLRLRL